MHVFVAASDVDAVRRDLDAGLPERSAGRPCGSAGTVYPTNTTFAHNASGLTHTSIR